MSEERGPCQLQVAALGGKPGAGARQGTVGVAGLHCTEGLQVRTTLYAWRVASDRLLTLKYYHTGREMCLGVWSTMGCWETEKALMCGLICVCCFSQSYLAGRA